MKKIMGFRLEQELIDRLQAAAVGPYAPTMTQIVEQGIELALRELGKLAMKKP